MRALTSAEGELWVEQSGMRTFVSKDSGALDGFEILFEAPRESRTQRLLARYLVTWLGPFEAAAMWLTDWPHYQPDEMAVVEGLRRADGEGRLLIDAPVHLFLPAERAELTGWLALMLAFGWDADVIIAPFRGSVFSTSPDDTVQAVTLDPERFREIREAVRFFGLGVRRETEPTA